jgi:hypothetical protein
MSPEQERLAQEFFLRIDSQDADYLLGILAGLHASRGKVDGKLWEGAVRYAARQLAKVTEEPYEHASPAGPVE